MLNIKHFSVLKAWVHTERPKKFDFFQSFGSKDCSQLENVGFGGLRGFELKIFSNIGSTN